MPLQFDNFVDLSSQILECFICSCRKIVLATNIAESSITIDDVVYVIDCGKAKETSYDALNKLACLLPSWISKASAHQVCCCYESRITYEMSLVFQLYRDYSEFS